MRELTIDKTKAWTADDYLLLGEIKTPCQLINGELMMSPAPNPNHQRVLRELFKIFDSFKLSGELFFAPIDLYIDEKNVFQPDLVYLSDQNRKHITSRGIEGPPDLVIEIISPSNSYTDRNQKKDRYLDFKIKEYWIVDPGNRTIEIYTPQGGRDVPVSFVSGEGEIASSTEKKVRFNLKDIF